MTFAPGSRVRTTTYLMVHSYWRHAQKAREPEHAMNSQAYLWGLATSPNAPERVRTAAFRHLQVLGEAPTTELEATRS